MKPEPTQKLPDDDQPPVLKNWRQIYLFVLLLHLLIITLFFFFTKAYA